MMFRRKRPDITPREFIEEKVLPKIIDLSPSEWIPELKEISSELSPEEKKAVYREGISILRRRKEIVDSVAEAIGEVRAMIDENGRSYGEIFKGVVFFGSFTGKSYGKINPKKALSPDGMSDLDVFPVITEKSQNRLIQMKVLGERFIFIESDNPLFGDLKEEGHGRQFQGFLGQKLRRIMTERTGIHCAVNVPITVAPEDSKSTVEDLTLIQRCFGVRPKGWYFVGDEETKRLFAERIRGL